MMRNRETSEFKGSAFVTFKTQEEMDKFMAEAETKFNDVVLEKQSKQNYYDSKSGKEKSKRFQSLMDCHLKIKNPRERLDKKTTTQSTELSNLAVLLTILSAEKRSSKLSRALLISPALSEAIPKVFVF
jgi:RNA recognition motif-containing protein